MSLDKLPVCHRRWILAAAAVAVSVLVFTYAPPDSFRRIGRTSSDLVPEKFADIVTPYGLDKGRHVVCFYSTSCPHCRHCVSKLAGIINRHSLPLTGIHCIFMQTMEDGKASVEDFFTMYGSGVQLSWHVLDPYEFISMTNGSIPLVILVEDGMVVREYDYISLDEEAVADWLR